MTRYAPALSRPSWRGRTNVDAITIAAIEQAEKYAGHTFTITQGSYQGGAGDPLSAGTHDMGGVVDIRWTGDPRDVLTLRKAGFAAWHRTPAQGPWPDHIHAVLIGHPLLAPAAARQVESYLRGMNGLKYERPDDGPRLSPIPRFTYPPVEDDMPLNDDDKKWIADTMDRTVAKYVGDVVDAVTPTGQPTKITVRTALKRLLERSGK